MKTNNSEPKVGKYFVQVNAVATVYEPRKDPIKKTGVVHGMTVPLTVWHNEHTLDEVAASYDGLYIKESDLEEMIKQLGNAIKQTMREKGLVKV